MKLLTCMFAAAITCLQWSTVFAAGWYGVEPARDGVYAHPYRYIGTVYCFWNDGKVSQGTGFLIGRSHVLTAAHLLYDFDHIHSKRTPAVVMFTPATYFGRAPVGSANAVKWAVAQPFMNGNKYYDYGMIKLNHPLGDRTLGWFTLDDWKKGQSYNFQISGYSLNWSNANSQINGYATGHSTNQNDPRNARDIHWSADGIPPVGGLSGSPAFYFSNNRYRVVGIYANGETANSIGGVKLDTTVRNEILNWVNNNP